MKSVTELHGLFTVSSIAVNAGHAPLIPQTKSLRLCWPGKGTMQYKPVSATYCSYAVFWVWWAHNILDHSLWACPSCHKPCLDYTDSIQHSLVGYPTHLHSPYHVVDQTGPFWNHTGVDTVVALTYCPIAAVCWPLLYLLFAWRRWHLPQVDKKGLLIVWHSGGPWLSQTSCECHFEHCIVNAAAYICYMHSPVCMVNYGPSSYHIHVSGPVTVSGKAY